MAGNRVKKFMESSCYWISVPGDPVRRDCSEEGNEDVDRLWAIVSVFITLFLLSVCYSATVTLFKVKCLFSTMLQLKQARVREYNNINQAVV